MATIKIPYLNPVMYTELDFVNPDLFASKHIDDFQFIDTIAPWQQNTKFKRIWGNGDSVRQQLTSGIGPVQIQLIDEDGDAVDTQNFEQLQQNVNDPAEYIYQHDYDLSDFDPGCYRFKLLFGSPVEKTFISEPFIISENIENTLLLEYTHYKFRGDVIFETGFTPYIRLCGYLKYKQPLSKDTLYEDQVLDETLLKSDPYDIWDLYLTGPAGMPDYLVKKINWMLGCSTFKIDGRQYTKNDGAKLQESAVDDYPMRGWVIELRDTINRASKIVTTDVNPNAKMAVVISIDSKGFGMDTGGNQSEVNDVE
jgi:hypothetical protein